MITAKDARNNVLRFDNQMKSHKKFEEGIFKLIDTNSKNGETSANVFLFDSGLRDGFIDEMVSLGFECEIIDVANVKTLVIKWG